MLCLNIPKKISITVYDNFILIQGPLGIKKKKISKDLLLYVDSKANKLWLLNTDLKEKHFFLTILNNLILGVLHGYSVKLNIVGVGYKAFVNEDILSLKIGFCHNVTYTIPKNISIKVLNQKLLTLIISGNDYQQVTQVAAEIRALKPVEPYKGKGIKYLDEVVKRKEGKKTNV